MDFEWRWHPIVKMTFLKTHIMKKIYFIIGALLLVVSTAVAQNIKVSGKVLDHITGEALPGANIILKGTHQGTVADVNGEFTIEIPYGHANPVLIIEFISYITKEIKIKGPQELTIELDPDVSSLDEVVVVGYGTSRRTEVTGAMTSVSFDSPLQGSTSGGYAAKSRKKDSKAVSYTQPAAEFNTEGYASVHENGYKSPLREPLSTFSIDVDAASYSNVRRFINDGQRPVKDAVRIEEMINYFDYDYAEPTGEHPFSIVHELGTCPWNKNNKLLHIGLQGKRLQTEQAPPSNLVFLLDVSGSMSDPNKLPLVVKAMKMLIGELRDEDRVAIVVYAGASGLVLPSTPGTKKEKMIQALDQLQAGGSTAGAEGLKLAYEIAEENFIKDGNNRIILATDGDFNVGPSSNAEMEQLITRYRDKGIFISVTGFGMGNYKDDKMEIIADKGNGNYSYIDNLMEARKVFVNEFSSTLYTIAKDVKIQIEFNPLYVKEYRLVGYENRMLNEEDFADDKKDAGEMGAGHSVTALYEIVPADGSASDKNRLKYQQSQVLPEADQSGELATIQFRYKKPDEDKSILMTEVISSQAEMDDQTSDNFRFSAAVAAFGMLLRDSEYKGSMNLDEVLGLAKGSKGEDTDGYRAEFIRLVELSETGLASLENN